MAETGQELSTAQREVLTGANHRLSSLQEDELLAIGAGTVSVKQLTTEQLVEFVAVANLLYRAGESLVDDRTYDHVFIAELAIREPGHPFLAKVEPEPVLDTKTVPLPVRMLSIDKAYDFDAMLLWRRRLEKAAVECGVDFESLLFRATPKLDGFAAYDDGDRLYTRGDGRRGTDISRVFERGLQVAGGKRGLGPGEIVVSRSYFLEHLAGQFDNSRNFQASLIKEKPLEAPAEEAIERSAAVFHPFSELPFWQGAWPELEVNFQGIIEDLRLQVDYDVDGVVFEIIDGQLKEYMGATRHHHRWQIAFKENKETAEVRVLQVVGQTSRSGRITPVAEVEPTWLSGATIQRATAHHYNMVREKGIGRGALIRLARSGEVIPKIEDVLEPVQAELPETCPSCDSSLVWDGDFLKCLNSRHCPAQISNSLEHFFKILGNIDGFGPSSIKKIYENGISEIAEIYRLSQADFEKFGFGPKQSENMVGQLRRSLEEPLEDFRFLAAFGIHRMGMGNCERLLQQYPLEDTFALTREQIVAIKGFSDKIADEMLSGMQAAMDSFEAMYAMGFNLQKTPLRTQGKQEGESVIAGKTVIFSGTMLSGKRDDMKKQAKDLGARVGSSISSKTDLLICGEKVGAAKLRKARDLAVQILSEQEYLELIGS